MLYIDVNQIMLKNTVCTPVAVGIRTRTLPHEQRLMMWYQLESRRAAKFVTQQYFASGQGGNITCAKIPS